MIPELIDGVLPEGIHHCTSDEIQLAFGGKDEDEQRSRLTANLQTFLIAASQSGIVAAVIVDGSYVTDKFAPNDVDLVVVYRADFDLRQELQPFEYNLLSRTRLRGEFGFGVFIERDESEGYYGWIDFFSRIRSIESARHSNRARKGLLRIDL